MLPNFLVVGVAKAGTTSLYHHLSDHQDIFIPARKECRFFSQMNGDFNGPLSDYQNDVIRSVKEYERLFEGSEKYNYIGDISNDYFYYHRKSIPKIIEVLGNDVPIIIILRNPIERTYSNYLHFAREGHSNESFLECLKKEDDRIENNWAWPWHLKQTSLYSEGVQAFIDHFKHTNVFIYEDYEDFQSLVNSILDQLGLDRISINSEIRFNRTGKPRFEFLHRMLLSENRFKLILTQNLKRIISSKKTESLKNSINKMNLKKPQIDQEVTDYLKSFFHNDVRNLEQILNRDLSKIWKI